MHFVHLCRTTLKLEFQGRALTVILLIWKNLSENITYVCAFMFIMFIQQICNQARIITKKQYQYIINTTENTLHSTDSANREKQSQVVFILLIHNYCTRSEKMMRLRFNEPR